MSMATGAATASNTKSLSVINSWPVAKYARLVSEPVTNSLIPQGSKAGSWKLFSSDSSGQIRLALLESNNLMVYNGAVIYESFSLWNAKKWIKGVTKGDSILFVHKINEDSRRFKIKLAASENTSSVEMCRQCITVLSTFITFREMGGQTNVHDSSFMDSQSFLDCSSQSQHPPQSPVRSISSATDNIPHPIPSAVTTQRVETSSLAKSLLQQPSLGLGRAYAETNFPTTQIGPFIQLCLSDPNFPSFVEQVDTELNKIIS